MIAASKSKKEGKTHMEMNKIDGLSDNDLMGVTGGTDYDYYNAEPDPMQSPCDEYVCSKCGGKGGMHRHSCDVGKTEVANCGMCRLLVKQGYVCTYNVQRQHGG